MSALYIMVPITLALAASFVLFFMWATKNGQWDDLKTPPEKILFDDEEELSTIKNNINYREERL